MMTLKVKREDWIAMVKNTVDIYGSEQCMTAIIELEKKMKILLRRK